MCASPRLHAQSPPTAATLPSSAAPAPVPPAVITRDGDRTTIRATRVDAPLRIDGTLDEVLYRTVEPVSGLIQIEPRPGDPERLKTEFWIAFDDERVYYAVRCWDDDMSGVIVSELRRDNNTIFTGNDMIAVMFDTFYDRQNGFAFNVNARGGRQDGQITNNRQFSADFNPIWEVTAGRFEGGWTLEAAIPFKSLRYRPGREQVWGFNLMRSRPRTNEIAFLQRMPPGRSRAGMTQISLGATLVGIEAPPPSRTISRGSMFHGSPLRSTKRMPVSTARSGIGVRPAYRRLRGRRFGRSGSMRLHRSSSIKAFGMPDRLAVGQANVPSPRSKYKRVVS